ncbi:MAG: prolipoprotein diacylglyceryl transferase [Eubacteriales bacterium]
MNTLLAHSDVNKISFPGLPWISDTTFEINEVAFTIPGTKISVAWYGILIMLGIFVAIFYIYKRAGRQKLILDDLLDLAMFTVIPGVIGARLYYVFFDWLRNPGKYTNLYDVISIWKGGLAIYGGIIFGAIACILTLRYKKIRIPAFFDCLAPAVMIAQSIGRWGNFCNGEAFGASTNLPWAMHIETSYDGGVTWFTTAVSAHPTFLYESLWNLIGFILLCSLYKHRKFDGQITLGYLTWYGFGRMFIEGLRTDSLYIGGTGIRVSQLIAFLCFIIAGVLLIWLTFFRYKTRSVVDCIYLEGAKALAKIKKSPESAQVESIDEAEAAPTEDTDSSADSTDTPDSEAIPDTIGTPEEADPDTANPQKTTDTTEIITEEKKENGNNH